MPSAQTTAMEYAYHTSTNSQPPPTRLSQKPAHEGNITPLSSAKGKAHHIPLGIPKEDTITNLLISFKFYVSSILEA
ncbi:hypothetical protein [Bartonella sp. AU55XJBT]|uniref:hypothetical protein n=1 Tax=Bartonella sp. AU55XJBT TaxID=3019091 RepID=UPI002360FCA3|nr:hypothetical protein [Bartonella sp. AU55XJBT]